MKRIDARVVELTVSERVTSDRFEDYLSDGLALPDAAQEALNSHRVTFGLPSWEFVAYLSDDTCFIDADSRIVVRPEWVLTENSTEAGSATYGWKAAVLVLVAGLLIGWWLSPRAEAAPLPGAAACVQAWQDPQGATALRCQSNGWVVRKHFVLHPDKTVLYLNSRVFDPCRHEDSNGPCYWVANERGNKQGRSFIIRGERDDLHRIWWVRF